MKATAQQEQPTTGLRAWQHCAVFLLACAVIISRRPDAIFHAQFWSEDGHVFFADAYNLGWWAPLFRTYQGYLHVFPRLGASLALLVPLSVAPLVLNLIAIGVQALPANLLLSSRSSAWGSLLFRALLAGMYLALPNCWEISTTITNSQSLLALNAFLLLAASRPHSRGGRVFDLCILLLCGLSGPFCICLLPIALFVAWKQRDRWRWVEVMVIAVGCSAQTWSLLNGGYSSRWHYPLGANPAMFFRILSGQIFLGTLLGGIPVMPRLSVGYQIVAIGIAAGGAVLVVVCFLRAHLPLKLFLFFSTMLLASALVSPALGPLKGITVWEVLASGAGNRYWFFPVLAFAWTILWCFQSRVRILKTVSVMLLCIMCFATALRWRHPALPDMHFANYVTEFEATPVGTAVTIPENPEGWNMTLVKHPPGR